MFANMIHVKEAQVIVGAPEGFLVYLFSVQQTLEVIWSMKGSYVTLLSGKGEKHSSNYLTHNIF